MQPTRRAVLVSVLALSSAQAWTQEPVGTAFTYQGRLQVSGAPASGSYDLRFVLYDAEVGGSQVGPIQLRLGTAVAGGVFTVSLDFGAVFLGQKRWLEIAVRPSGGSGYAMLGSRQELTPSPSALFSATTGDATVQRRNVAPTCPPGEFLRSLAADGTPTCGADVVGSGTVVSVGTGEGLTGGPITVGGTVAVAPGGITSALIAPGAVGAAQIAPGAVGLAQLDPTQVQARVTGTCPLGHYLRGVQPDGTVQCEPLVNPHAVTVVDDPAAAVGQYTSIAIPPDGLPVISYQDLTARALKVAKCLNRPCTQRTVRTVDDPANEVGHFSSIAIAPDGRPVIAYLDATLIGIRVVRCGNADCSAGNLIGFPDFSNTVLGWYLSLAIGSDGLPVISYFDERAGGTLRVAHCDTLACNGLNTATTVDDDPTNTVGAYTAIAIGTDGLPVISYQDQTAAALKVAHCGNPACTSGNTITTVDDPANAVGQETAIAIGADGLPIISYVDYSANALKVAHCGNPACSSGNTATTIADPDATVLGNTSIAVGADGLPVISYYDAGTGSLKVLHCGNLDCTAGNLVSTLDPPPYVGDHSSIAAPADGPVISYFDGSAGRLKLVKCGTVTCR